MYPAAEKTHKPLTSHLEKSIISNVIQTARACLNEPSRPYTPAETQRALFSQNDYANRPPSSYVPKPAGRPHRNRSQDGTTSSTSLRKDKTMLREPVRLQSRELELYESTSSTTSKLSPTEPVRPVRPRVDDPKPSLPPSLPSTLQSLQAHEPLRSDYKDKDWDALASEVLASAKTSDPAEMCGQVLTLVEATENVSGQIRMLKAVLTVMLDMQLLSRKASGKLKVEERLLSACKLAYQPSKQRSNDPVYLETGLMSVLFEIVVKLLADELVEMDGGDQSMPFQTLIYLLGTIKNLTDDDLGRQQALNLGLIVVLARLLPLPDDISPKLPPDYVNFAGDKATYTEMLLGQVVERSLRTLDLFFEHSELIFNTCRVLSKLSIDEKCCRLMLDKENLYNGISLMQRVLLAYSEHAAVVSRLSFTLANLAMLYEEARAVMGPEGFDSIVETILVPLLPLSTASKTHFDALLKTVRLIANIVLDPETGTEMTQGGSAISHLSQTLQTHSNHDEMTLITISCLANILYYDQPQRPVIALATTRESLVRLLSPGLMQTGNFEITREALRALSNLTRHEEAAREAGVSHLVEPLILLLDHGCGDIVYYSLGCLMNLSRMAKEFVYSEQCFERFATLLAETGVNATDISLQVAMVLGNLCSPTKGLVPWEGVAGEDVVKRLSVQLASLLTDAEGKTGTEALCNVLRSLKDAMPSALLPCPASGCGRKFPSKEKLAEHWDRRHKD